jgi:hypothetical protein
MLLDVIPGNDASPPPRSVGGLPDAAPATSGPGMQYSLGTFLAWAHACGLLLSLAPVRLFLWMLLFYALPGVAIVGLLVVLQWPVYRLLAAILPPERLEETFWEGTPS